MKGITLFGSLVRIGFVAILVHVAGRAGYALFAPEVWLLLLWPSR